MLDPIAHIVFPPLAHTYGASPSGLYARVWVAGFEPAISWLQTRQDDQASPHPDRVGARIGRAPYPAFFLKRNR